jgi:transglutaminase-like putative cysteine protease
MTVTLPSGRRIQLTPPEGWLTVFLVLLLCLSLAWSLDDALLVLGQGELTDFLTWTAVGGVLAGFGGAMVQWGRWRTYLIGALVAALITPLLVGWVLLPDGGTLTELFRATAGHTVLAWRDLIWENRFSTAAYGHHLVLLGLIVWASSMFASFAAFGHRRPLNAVLLIGVLLVVNMSLTTRPQLPYLVLYSIASLFLLIRFHTFDEQSDWVRRRIGDPATISSLYLRGGTIFIVATVLGSLLLTNVANSRPLAGMWTDMGGRVIEWSQFFEKYLPISGSGRSIGPSFGSTARITGVWTTNDDPALTWTSATVLEHPPYLAAAYYDVFGFDAWQIGPTVSVDRAAGDELLAGTSDAVEEDGRREYAVTVTPGLSRDVVWAPEMPVHLDGQSTVALIADGAYLGRVQRPASNTRYAVTSRIRAEEKDGGPTENKLRVAGESYPEGMLERYGAAAVPEGAFESPEAQALLDEIVAESPDNPYDVALHMVRTLQDTERFTYDTEVRDLRCDYGSVVDCFAVNRHGYCEHFASTMAIMLRELDIPARIVEGFLPGKKIGPGATYQVRNSDSHAWVQVYFPKWGWIDFDPTGGRAALPPLPSGQPEASASAGTTSSLAPFVPTTRPEPDEGPAGAGTSIDRSGPAGPLIVISILLAVIVGAVAVVAWRRGPRGPVTADSAYGTVVRFASRLGFAPRPNQTVYEYAGALAELLPDARPELETVAQAKVEVAYSGQRLGLDRLAGLREAQRRLRTSLLRLAFRRDRRRRRRP